jgi:hypothetical protein
MLDNFTDAIQNHMTQNVQVPELIWIAATLGVLWFKFLNVRDARTDLKLLKESKLNHFREVVATSILYTDSARAVVALLYLGIGIEALFENPHDPHKIDFGYMYFAGSLFASVFIFLWTAWYSRITRKRLVAMWEDAQLEIEDGKKQVIDLQVKAVSLASQTKEDTTALNAKSKKARKGKTAKPESPEA